MAEYNEIGSYGGVFFGLGDIRKRIKSATLKTQLGKTFIEKNIPLVDKTNDVLQISGVITGLSRTSGQTLSAAIEVDRAALEALQDGTFHTWADGKHSGNFAISPESLVFDDEAVRGTGQPYKFSMILMEW